MSILPQVVVQGLAMGAIYGLVALGLVLLINAANLINFAVGDMVMLGAFLVYTLVSLLHLPFWAGFAVTVALGGVAGLIVERIAYRPIRGGDVGTYLVSTLAAAMLIRNLAQQAWGAVPYSFTEPFGRRILRWQGVSIQPQHLLILAFTLLLAAWLYWFFYHTRTGKLLRATAQDREAARLLGISVAAIGSVSWALASGLGALAGVLVAPIFFVNLNMGFIIGLKAFIATIIGGWGSVPGAFAGGMIVGLTEVLATTYISSTYKDSYTFVVLLLFLIVLPRGLFGERTLDRA